MCQVRKVPGRTSATGEYADGVVDGECAAAMQAASEVIRSALSNSSDRPTPVECFKHHCSRQK